MEQEQEHTPPKGGARSVRDAGRVAFEAFRRRRGFPLACWHELPTDYRDAWRAAALAAQMPEDAPS